MRLPLLLLLSSLALNAGIYKAKVEPYQSYSVSAEAQGRIVALDLNDELHTHSKTLVTIDHALESVQLENLQGKLGALDEQLAIKRDQHARIMNVSGKSQFEKEQSRLNLLALETQRFELLNTLAQLKDTLRKKEVRVQGCYLKKFYVRKHEYVMPGNKLFLCEEQSRQRLVLYADAADAQQIAAKRILINGEVQHGFRLDKAALSTDETYISAYRIELVGKSSYRLGEMLSVEIRE